MGTIIKEGLLEKLAKGPVIGDGSYVITLEKRGYVKAGPFSPEAVVEHPDAVEQLHKDFLWAGSDAIQAFTFYATEGKLKLSDTAKEYSSEQINQAGCDLVKKQAEPANALTCGGISPTPTFTKGGSKDEIKAEFKKQVDIFVKNDIDFILGEFFGDIVETEIAIGTMKETKKPVACTMRIGPTGDVNDVSVGECAVRMAKAGADLVGVNCQYDPFISLKVMKMMKEALDKADLKPYLIMQPVGYHCPETEHSKWGYHDLPEFPFALEPRLLTRWDVRKYTREAYVLGVRYFGGCCGFEPYHIREMSEELAKERGRRPPGARCNSDWGEALSISVFPPVAARSGKDYWSNLKPSFGRPDCPITAKTNTFHNK